MEAQEIFDTVSKHLFAQGEKSEDGKGSCEYRTKRGLKCAVGCLIPDEAYHPDMEGWSVREVLKYHGDLLPAWLGLHCALLGSLQAAHDFWGTEGDLRRKLTHVAEVHALSPAILNDLQMSLPTPR